MEKGIFRVSEVGLQREHFKLPDKGVNDNDLYKVGLDDEEVVRLSEKIKEQGLPSREQLGKMSMDELERLLVYIFKQFHEKNVTSEETAIWKAIVDEINGRTET